ncbi:HEAT repeat domain-containing protein [Iningainema tapete]|uniref:HEAT repeat domain-containing protein n=1 Tax=Iningainema tapete BLCC-T55 TaxID=2748662 RepID=A0A8J6XK42_9CYAN|nr:HEAT repeat domain-containing protein [Iningainema tapete]MBD2774372.1 HEAT repeat domain-containing protein [Iningainema tapete BLCC-T55]
MARPSYGPEAKRRAGRLLASLLAYANDELECCDEAALESLRSGIQTRWQFPRRLIVKTKVRFLQVLTGLQSGESPLSAEQVKEALKRFTDFLAILEDNRPTRGGSETWHFTLHLWCDRHNTQANLQQFDLEWESRRPEKSKQVALGVGATTPLPPLLDWREVCRTTLEMQNQRRLTTNPLTSVDGCAFEFDEVYVPLGLVERKQRERLNDDVSPVEGSRLYAVDTEVTQISPDEFLEIVLRQRNCKRIAIVGEPGAGKTTLLQKITAWLLNNTQDLPIWISLADLQGKTLEQYLIEDWLRAATRKLHVTPEVAEDFCTQFNQGRVWLLLDAVDEMAMESTHALTKIASFLTGWIADATVVLTCRLNVWDAGKNALEAFETYRNLHFTYGDTQTPDQVGLFIRHWFKAHPELAVSLRAELEQPGRGRIKDAVRNPLRLALLCRTWGVERGLPKTKAMLYEQFVEVIYQWKQEYFPTTYAQRQQLNQALGELALQAFAQEKTKFRLKHRFICQVLGAPDEGLFQLALQLGWLNQVGISETEGEKVYAFYHSTFQEYFAALAINDWHFFLNSEYGVHRIFDFAWREVILLWLGREDIPQTQKEEFIQALINFSDGCGGFYRYQAYFLAAIAIPEFADCSSTSEILAQLIKWRFGYFHSAQQRWWRFPPPIVEGARVALLKSERKFAIAALEEFIKTSQNDFDTWNAAYSLGKIFDPGNQLAISKLAELVTSIRHENLRWQVADSLGKIDRGNSQAIAALIEIIESTKKDALRRKAAYSLGKIAPGNDIAISTLSRIISSTTNDALRAQAAENLRTIAPYLASAFSFVTPKREYFPKAVRKKSIKNTGNNARVVTALIEGIALSSDEDTKRRRACKLATIYPGNPVAFSTLLYLVKSAKSESVRKCTADNLKKVMLDEQMPALIKSLKDCFSDIVSEIEMEKFCHCYKLLWYCAEKMTYLDFYQAWHGEIITYEYN